MNSGTVRSPAGGEVTKKVTDSFTVRFEPVSDREFIRWMVIDSSTGNDVTDDEYLVLSTLTDSETECTFKKAPEGEMRLSLVPELAERPQILSYAPLYVAEGSPKDSAIQVTFDYDMDPDSIYYSTDELTSLGVAEKDFLKTGVNEEIRYYGYKDNKGNYFFKNIHISDNETGTNRNNCFSAPVFESPRRLSISIRKDTGASDYKELPSWSEVLVSLGNGFFYKSSEKHVAMASGRKWIYQVTDSSDRNPPVIDENTGFSMSFTDGRTLTPISSSQFPGSPWNSESTPFNDDRKLNLNFKLKDIGSSGPADSFTLKLQKVGTYTYDDYGEGYSYTEDTPVSFETLIPCKFQGVSGQFATFSGTVDFSDTILDAGVYRVSFVFRDKCGNVLEYASPVSNARYYFSVDMERRVRNALYMPIEDRFNISGRGTVVTGTIARGHIQVGDSICIIGMDTVYTVTVQGIEMYNKPLEYADAGDNAGIMLGTQISKDDIQRGMVICTPYVFENRRKFRSSIYLRTKEEGGRTYSISTGYRPQFYLGTTDVTGVTTFDGSISPGSNANIEVELLVGMPIYVGQKFAIRDGGRTVADGTITALID